MCGGTREALTIRRTLLYSVAKRVKLFYLSRVVSYEPPTPKPSALTAHPPCLIWPGPLLSIAIRVFELLQATPNVVNSKRIANLSLPSHAKCCK